MNIEFRTVYDTIENEKMGQLYAKYCMDDQLRQMKIVHYILCGICLIGVGISAYFEFVKDIHIPAFIFVAFAGLSSAYYSYTKKKIYPKAFSRINGVGCPYNVTFGLYDDYFYEKYEGSMSVSENSVRYEFLKKVVETPEYFVLMTQRTQVFFLPKRAMGYEPALEFSMFCKLRLGSIYSFKN